MILFSLLYEPYSSQAERELACIRRSFPPWVKGAFMKQLAVLWSLIVLELCSFCILTTPSWSADKDQSDIEKRIDNSAKVLDEIMGTPDKGIPDKIMSDAKCIAIIPSM